MFKTLERAFNPCKSADLRRRVLASGWDRVRWPLPRIVFWASFSVLMLIVAFLIDEPVANLLRLRSSTVMSQVAGYASKAGEGWVVGVAGLAGSLFWFWRRRFKASEATFLIAFTGLMTGATATIIRSLVGRTRPSSHELQGFYGVWHDSHWIIGQYEFGAFPSGHAATVIGLAAAAWLIDRRLGLLAACYAILVSWSRIAMGCHHFSDAVAAAILGIYGAHLVLGWVGPKICRLSEHLQNAWFGRKSPAGASRNR